MFLMLKGISYAYKANILLAALKHFKAKTSLMCYIDINARVVLHKTLIGEFLVPLIHGLDQLIS